MASSSAPSFPPTKLARFYGQPDLKSIETTALKPPPIKKRKPLQRLVLKNPDLDSQGTAVLPEPSDEENMPLTPMVFGPSDAIDDIYALRKQESNLAADSDSVDIPDTTSDSPDGSSCPATPPSIADGVSDMGISRFTPSGGRDPSPIPLQKLQIPRDRNHADIVSPLLPTGLQTSPRSSPIFRPHHAWSGGDISSELLSPATASADDLSFIKPSPIDSMVSLSSIAAIKRSPTSKPCFPGVPSPAASPKSAASSSPPLAPPSPPRPRHYAPSPIFTSPMVFASINPHIAVAPAPPMPPLFAWLRAKAPSPSLHSPLPSPTKPQMGPTRMPTSRLKRIASQSRFFSRRAFSVSDFRDAPASAENRVATVSFGSAASELTHDEKSSIEPATKAQAQYERRRVTRVMGTADMSRKGVEVTMSAEHGQKEMDVDEVISSLRMLKTSTRTGLW